MTATVPSCAECGTPIPKSAHDGFCPICLFGLADTLREDPAEIFKDATSKPNHPGGSVFGNYELLEPIGEGGMGVVFKARQTNLNRVVALKMLRSGPLASESEKKRFRSEAQAAAQLQHPNLVAIHEVGEHEGRLFFSMDCIDGPSLAQVIRRTPLPPKRAARYVKIIAEAVHYAHQRGVLHRDLKPGNVLIDAQDQPRVTDFGLAKQIEIDSDLTVSGAVLGTPSYMPPEQAAGRRKEISARSDVYSLGAILYDLLTGRPPFRADSPVDTLRQVLDEEPASPRLLNRKVSRDLETICLKCLSKEPAQRFQTAQELADDLERFLNGQPIQAQPIGWLGRGWRWCRRNPTVAGLTGLVSIILAMLGVAAMLFRQDLLEANVHAARLAAKVIAGQLEKLAQAVQTVAGQTALAELIQSGDTNRLETFLRGQYEWFEGGELKWMDANPFESWSLFDTNGFLLARWPSPEITPNKGFHDRDHFLSALKMFRDSSPPAPYVSLIYRSRTDRRQDKFGISLAVSTPDRSKPRWLGVLLATVTTAPTGTLSGLQHNAVLIGRADPSDERKQFLIVAHPAFSPASQGIAMDRLPTRAGTDRSGFYSDPAAVDYPRYSGRWLAGWAPVENTHFLVVVQARDRVTDALATAALFALLAGAGLVAWRFILARFWSKRTLD